MDFSCNHHVQATSNQYTHVHTRARTHVQPPHTTPIVSNQACHCILCYVGNFILIQLPHDTTYVIHEHVSLAVNVNIHTTEYHDVLQYTSSNFHSLVPPSRHLSTSGCFRTRFGTFPAIAWLWALLSLSLSLPLLIPLQFCCLLLLKLKSDVRPLFEWEVPAL